MLAKDLKSAVFYAGFRPTKLSEFRLDEGGESESLCQANLPVLRDLDY